MSAVSLAIPGRTGIEVASNDRKEARSSKSVTEPLARVLAGCRQCRPESQRELVMQTQDRVFRTVFRLVGLEDADDVSQQVYLQVFRQLDQFDGRSQFRTWLYRITINEALQHLRRRKGMRTETLAAEPQDQGSNHCHREENRELLSVALSEIDPQLRSIFLLREAEGLTYEQIAKAVGIPMGTVASRLSRAREELQARLRMLGWNG
jgi:RNA polymerase sigma-70 factor (ECF subfamily)